MATTTTTGTRADGRSLAKTALGLGIVSIIVFVALGFLVDWFFVVGFVIAVAAVITGWIARKRPGDDHQRMATAGMLLGAVPFVWFIAYMIVAAIT